MDNVIEVSNKKYWKELTYYDGLLYCSLLIIDKKNDWRMPKYDEEDYIGKLPNSVPLWYYEDGESFETILNTQCYWIVPVRDV